MITLKDFFELANYRITEGSQFCWECYGPNAYCLDSWQPHGRSNGYNISVVFDTKTQEVYEASVCDYTNSIAHRYTNPKYAAARATESDRRGVNNFEAWEEVAYIEVDAETFKKEVLEIVVVDSNLRNNVGVAE